MSAFFSTNLKIWHKNGQHRITQVPHHEWESSSCAAGLGSWARGKVARAKISKILETTVLVAHVYIYIHNTIDVHHTLYWCYQLHHIISYHDAFTNKPLDSKPCSIPHQSLKEPWPICLMLASRHGGHAINDPQSNLGAEDPHEAYRSKCIVPHYWPRQCATNQAWVQHETVIGMLLMCP